MFDKLPVIVYNAFELKSSKTAPPPIIYAKKAPADMQGLLAFNKYFFLFAFAVFLIFRRYLRFTVPVL